MKNLRNLKDPFICRCNSIQKTKIEGVISRGANSVNKIYDATTAGLGACGGSCRPILKKMLEHYEKTGKFLEHPEKLRK